MAQSQQEDRDFEPREQQEISLREKIQTKFQRPLIDDFNPQQTDLFMMGIDITTQVRKCENQNHQKSKQPYIIIYAATKYQQAIKVVVSKFRPYFYSEIPAGMEQTRENLQLLRDGINQKVRTMKKRNQISKQDKIYEGNQQQQQEIPDAVVNIEIVHKINLKYYVPQKDKINCRYLKIQAKTPGIIPSIRKLFHFGQSIKGVYLPRKTFQSNILYPLRFMIDKDLVGMGWFKICKGKYKVKPQKMNNSYCQLEIQCQANAIESIKSQGQWAVIAPLRVLSFDIQCISSEGFPSAQRREDKIIQIACICKSTAKPVQDFKVLFALKGSAPISGTHIKQVTTQEQLLIQFQTLIRSYDPDFLIGYNIINFDLKYIIERAKFLKMRNYGKLGRSVYKISKLRDTTFQSKVMGMRQTKQINIEGRIQLDLMIHMHRQHKLSSYTLNNVSFYFLGDQKQDVHHSEIRKLFQMSRQSRKRLGVYCIKDAQLPLRLMEKLCCLYNYSEMSRVTGVPINYLLSKGQQIKVTSQLLRKAKQHHYIMPNQAKKQSGDEVAFEGASVLEPVSGFYQQPIATLDFASLYPSIMMAHNLCYTTLVNLRPENKKGLEELGLKPEDYTITPMGNIFVKSRQGLLPQILRQLISARKKAKKQLGQATDPFLKAVLEGRQLALKISANSVYGYTGATVGHLPCLQISSSVTSFGRKMIQFTRYQVLRRYPNSQVIYGDTDSVMVKFKIDTDKDKTQQIKQAMEYGKIAANQISKQFINPIKLQFQKVYCPYLLITKKRYAGVYYTKPDQPDKIDKKGLQTVRRDNCLLIRQMLEKVINLILIENNKKKASQYIKSIVSELVQNKIDISKLVISKAITKKAAGEESQDQQKGKGAATKSKDNQKAKKNTYKAKQAHSELAEKMKKRDQNLNIHIGDRISYVMIIGPKGSKNYQNSQDPIRVLQNDLPIDFDYYIQRQLKPPLQRLLKNTKIIDNFDMLFVGDHTKNRYIPKIKQNTFLSKFVIIQSTCVNCPARSPQYEPLCKKCRPLAIDIFLSKQKQIEKLQSRYSHLEKQCHQCQGFVSNQVICQNNDCPLYYQKTKIKHDIKEKKKTLDKLDRYQIIEDTQEEDDDVKKQQFLKKQQIKVERDW